MRGNLTRQEADFIQPNRLLGQFREMNMPEMHGIKSAAEESDFSRGYHGFRSELYRRKEM